MEGRQAPDDVTGLEHRQPSFGGGMGDADIRTQGGKVYQLAGSAGTEPQKGLERDQVAHV